MQTGSKCVQPDLTKPSNTYSLAKVYIHPHLSNIIIYGPNAKSDGTSALYTYMYKTLGIFVLHSDPHGKNCYPVVYSKAMLMPKKLLSIAKPDGCTTKKKATEIIQFTTQCASNCFCPAYSLTQQAKKAIALNSLL